MAVLGPRFCARALSSCGKRGPLFIAVRGPLAIVASLVAEHRLQTRRLSNCGSRAQPLRGMWDLPRPGLEPVSPALAGGLPTTAPPGKPYLVVLICISMTTNGAERLSMCLLAICVSFFWAVFIQGLCPFLNWVVCSWIVRVLCMFWILNSYQINALQIFSPIL